MAWSWHRASAEGDADQLGTRQRLHGAPHQQRGAERADPAPERGIRLSAGNRPHLPGGATRSVGRVHELLNAPERRRRDLPRERVTVLEDGSKVAGFLRQLVTSAADRPEALVDRVQDEALERRRPRVADLARDLPGGRPRLSEAISRRLETSGRRSGSYVIRRSESVLAARMRRAVSSALAASGIELPRLLPILRPSRPSRSGATAEERLGSGK